MTTFVDGCLAGDRALPLEAFLIWMNELKLIAEKCEVDYPPMRFVCGDVCDADACSEFFIEQFVAAVQFEVEGRITRLTCFDLIRVYALAAESSVVREVRD